MNTGARTFPIEAFVLNNIIIITGAQGTPECIYSTCDTHTEMVALSTSPIKIMKRRALDTPHTLYKCTKKIIIFLILRPNATTSTNKTHKTSNTYQFVAKTSMRHLFYFFNLNKLITYFVPAVEPKMIAKLFYVSGSRPCIMILKYLVQFKLTFFRTFTVEALYSFSS